MEKTISDLKEIAEYYSLLYNKGQCDRETAKQNIMPYINKVNEKSKELAKKYNQKPRYISFNNYVR